jgi:hypothetical protein
MSEEDIKEDELEIELEEAEEEAPKVEEQVQDDDAGDAVEAAGDTSSPKKSSKFQKRIDDLVHKQKEAERQRDEYYKVAQRVMDENNSLRTTAKEFSNTSVSEMEARITSDIDKATSDFKKAYEEGEADKLVEAQKRLIQASSQTGKLDNLKQQAAPEYYEPHAPIAPPPDTKAVDWARQNPWFERDRVMTNAAYAIHDEVVSTGVEISSDRYFDLINQRMREEFPHKFTGSVQDTSDQPRKGTATSVVTPGGNQTGRSKKVRLSPSQVAVAKRLGVPLEEYAKQFVALEN